MPGAYVPVNTVSPPAPPLTESSLGANDSSARGSTYLVNEFTSAGAGSDVSVFSSGSGNYAGTGPGAGTLNPGEIALHPGVACVQTVAVGYGIVAAYNPAINACATSPATYTWSVTFRTPSQLSNATDTFKFYAGCSAGVSGAYPGTGAGVCYTHSQNSGNWQIYCVNTSAETEQDTVPATSIAFTAGTWNTVQVVLASGKFTISLNGTTLGTLTDSALTGTNNWQMSGGSINMQRSAIAASSPPTISALIDRASVYITGLGR